MPGKAVIYKGYTRLVNERQWKRVNKLIKLLHKQGLRVVFLEFKTRYIVKWRE